MTIDPKRLRFLGPRSSRPASAATKASATPEAKPSAPGLEAPRTAGAASKRDAFDAGGSPLPSPRLQSRRARDVIAEFETGVRGSFLQAVSFDSTGAIARVVHQAVTQGPLLARPTSEQKAFATLVGMATTPALRALSALASNAASPLWQPSTVEAAAEMLDAPLNAALLGKTNRVAMLSDMLVALAEPPRRVAPGAAAIAHQFLQTMPQRAFQLLTSLAGPSGRAAWPGGATVQLPPEPGTAMQLIERALRLVMRDAPTAGEALRRAYDHALGRHFEVHEPATAGDAARLLRAAHARTPVVVDVERGAIRYALLLEGSRDDRVLFRDPSGALRSAPEADLAAAATHVSVPR